MLCLFCCLLCTNVLLQYSSMISKYKMQCGYINTVMTLTTRLVWTSTSRVNYQWKEEWITNSHPQTNLSHPISGIFYFRLTDQFCIGIYNLWGRLCTQSSMWMYCKVCYDFKSTRYNPVKGCGLEHLHRYYHDDVYNLCLT